MKKLLSALIVCALLFAVPFAANAESCNSYIYAEGTEYSPGQTLHLTYTVDADLVSGLSAEIKLSDNLTLISAEGMLEGWDFDIAETTVVMYDTEGETPVSGETEFFKLMVKVDSKAMPGDEIFADITAKAASVEKGYVTLDTKASFETLLEECSHRETVWQVVTPPSGGNAGVRAEVCVVCGITLGSQEFSYPLGDVDLNGTVNVIDAVLVARYASSLITLNAEQLECADVDGNGVANIMDAVLISRYSAGLISKFPAEQ